MREKRELCGRTAAITGASSGIGRAIAIALAEAGAHCFVHARQNQEGAQQTAELVRAHGVDSNVFLADLTLELNCDDLVRKAWQWRDGVDIWVNNAGTDVLTGAARNWSFAAKLEQLWLMDVRGTMHLSRSVGHKMKERGRGIILNMGWDQAERGMEGDSGELFAAIKGAITCFSRSLAQSLAPAVRVNCLAPGWIQTSWGVAAPDHWQHRAKKESLLNRWGTDADVAQVARFLASDAAAFVNGQVIPINGGFRYGATSHDQ